MNRASSRHRYNRRNYAVRCKWRCNPQCKSLKCRWSPTHIKWTRPPRHVPDPDPVAPEEGIEWWAWAVVGPGGDPECTLKNGIIPFMYSSYNGNRPLYCFNGSKSRRSRATPPRPSIPHSVNPYRPWVLEWSEGKQENKKEAGLIRTEFRRRDLDTQTHTHRRTRTHLLPYQTGTVVRSLRTSDDYRAFGG